jgi:hypothetical protein
MNTKEFFTPAGPPSDRIIYQNYENVKLKDSSSADVLAAIHLSEYELLSQSKSVIASQGEKKRSHKMWFDMVAFNEDEMTAARKYIVMVDERPKVLFVDPWTDFRFNCKMVFEEEILDEPYDSENARRVEVLKKALEYFRADVSEVEQDNKDIELRGMMVNQVFETVLVKLKAFPALAARLDKPEGIKFEHINLDKGRIRMRIDDANDIVDIRVKLGQSVKKLKFSEDVNDY